MTGTWTIASGRYELEPLPIAKGGMGEVYFGRDSKLEREVAVKFIRFPDGEPDRELTRRFVRESRLTARLEHPGVPSIYDVGTHDQRPYLVMQRIRGITIADLVAEQGPLSVGWASAIAAQTCAVLVVAHQASLVHRDLKPANLMLTPDGGVKVLDFGLAVALDGANLSKITQSGQSLGTPAYMAPEQVLAATSSPKTDLYALGCTLYEMLTAEHPFTGSTSYAVMNKQVDEPPRSVREHRTEVPDALDRLVLELLAKRPDDRPANAAEVFDRLLPFVASVDMLPGVLHPPSVTSSVRMYATAISRVHADPPAFVPSAAPVVAGASDPAVGMSAEPVSLSRNELDRARAEAGSLVRQARYSQAAKVLTGIVEPASRVFGGIDSDVVDLRLQLANVLFEGGDFGGALVAYQRLVADLITRDGPDAELVFRCRMHEATCHALLGETHIALEKLLGLLADEHRVFGREDPRPLELRRQIGLLQLGVGERETATATLRELLADLVRRHGPDHPAARKVGELLDQQDS